MSTLRRPLAGLGAVVLVALGLTLPTSEVAAAPPAEDRAAAADDSFTATKTLTRVFTEADDTLTTVSSREVTVRAEHTRNLRGRQRVRITWSGAQPSGGRASNPYGEKSLQQEYPVVIMQCRGRDDATLPPAKQLRPETCWTASVAQRSQTLRSNSESTWLRDLYGAEADKVRVSGMDPIPADECPDADIAPYNTHLTEFITPSGRVYPACDSDSMPPEAAIGAAFPPAEIAAFTDEDGEGSVQFEVRSDVENESLGCNDKVACSIVVIPIVGVSCDKPSSPTTLLDRSCRKLGRFAPGSSNFSSDGVDQAVGPALWWSESNWRNRFTIPITFGLPPDTCDVLDSRPPTGFYGSELLAQASLQWSPAYCLDQKRFKFQLNQMSDAAGFNLMESGEGPAAVVSSLHETSGSDPIGYAPTAVTGFAIGYEIDLPDNAGEFSKLRLNARLIAKLLTQSYLGSDLGRGHPGIGENPLAIMNDPEFIALNPGLTQTAQEAGAPLLTLSNSSDIIQQLTAYLAQDKQAMAFIGGEPDPWGMVVNPSYQDIDLPRAEWPLLDTYIPVTQNECRQQNPSVYFNQLAAPVTTLRKIAEALLDAWPNVQTRCDFDQATRIYKLGRIDRQSYGARFLIGVVSLGDAARYGLKAAALQTDQDTFVGPTDAALARAVSLTTQDKPRRPFVLDQADVVSDGKAYPGTMIVYTAAKTRGLDQETADHVAQFIRISTTEGQKVGSGNGELPAGYLPIKSTGPTAKLLDSAVVVADAVEAQTPKATDPEDPEPEDPDPTDPPTTDPDLDPGTPLPDTPSDVDPPGGDGVPTDAPTTEEPVVDAPVLDDAVPTSATPATDAGVAGWMVPVLLGAGLLGLLISGATRFLVRPPRGPA